MLLVGMSSMWWEADKYGNILVGNGGSDSGRISSMVDCWGGGEDGVVMMSGRWVGKESANEMCCSGNAYGIGGVCCV